MSGKRYLDFISYILLWTKFIALYYIIRTAAEIKREQKIKENIANQLNKVKVTLNSADESQILMWV